MSESDNLPAWTGAPGHYEVWFLTLSDAASGTGYWIRSTLSAPTRGDASGGVWFARFDRTDPSAVVGLHRASSAFQVARDRFHVRIGEAEMASGTARGSVEAGGRRAEWDLTFATGDPTYRLLPQRLYGMSLVPTKPLSPNVATRVAGTVTVDGATIELAEVPAQQGHLYGVRHAERWAWAHCSDFIDEDVVVHVLVAQGKRGPPTTPFLTFAGVRWQGRWIRFSKARLSSGFDLGSWKVDLANRSHRLSGRIEAPARAMIRARYADPSGEARFCHNSEIASSRLTLFERRARGWDEVALLESRGTTHAEWAGRTAASSVQHAFLEFA